MKNKQIYIDPQYDNEKKFKNYKAYQVQVVIKKNCNFTMSFFTFHTRLHTREARKNI